MHKGIQNLFSGIPDNYRLINHIQTFYLDVYWRKRAVEYAGIKPDDTHYLDVCTGTGDMIYEVCKKAGKNVRAAALDFNCGMLREAVKDKRKGKLVFLAGDSAALPFRDNSFDLVTIAFATRNLNVNKTVLIGCFREFYRVLKPGGRFINLETSQPPSGIIRWFFHRYVKTMVKPVGTFFSGERNAYKYLSQTIPRFFTAEKLTEIIKQAGFSDVTFIRMTFGTTAVHKAIK